MTQGSKISTHLVQFSNCYVSYSLEKPTRSQVIFVTQRKSTYAKTRQAILLNNVTYTVINNTATSPSVTNHNPNKMKTNVDRQNQSKSHRFQ